MGEATSLSFALDESTDISDTAQLCIWVRLVDDSLVVEEHFLRLIGLKGQTTGQIIFDVFHSVLDELNVAFSSVVSVTTDGAPAMAKKFVRLVKRDMNSAIVPFHCIIHQQDLCAEDSDMLPAVMAQVVKIVNAILANKLSHRQFKAIGFLLTCTLLSLLENMHELLLMCFRTTWRRWRLLTPTF